ncbi:TetR family transcriptional regulator [Nonomuraea sp. NPDC050310]|uniref:TetR family transcriptional regulator n=1 Tax=unclassified Nonomuraea TaxID=2593643 RepID=UPI0033F9FEE4
MARIALSAAKLAVEQGLVATTVDRIAEDARVSRATFFRYFPSKECAVADGLTRPFLDPVIDALARQPSHLPAIEAILAAFDEAACTQTREAAELTRASATLSAWTLSHHQRYEQTIADLITPRLTETDAGPRLIAALVMAAVRLSVEDWLDQGGPLPQHLHRTLRSAACRQ